MDVFTLVKDSDVPVLLVSQPTVVHVDESVTHFSGSQRHTVGSVSHTVWACHAESEWKACARRQAVKTAGWGPGPVRVAGETAGTFGSGPGGPDGWGSCGGGGG